MTPTSAIATNEAASSSGTNWLDRGLWLALLLACAVALSPNNVDPDLWGHVQYGADWLADGQLPRTATHTFTAVGYEWINHENLSELSLALGAQWLGPHGLLIAKCFLGLGLLALMLRGARRQGTSLFVACGFYLLVTTTLTAFWSLRPQLASFLLLGLMLLALEAAFSKWHETGRISAAPLWAIPLVMAVWVNSHGGFLAGLALLAAYFGCRSLEALWHRGREAWRTIALMGAVYAASVLATLANPYGWRLLLWVRETLSVPPPEITEWMPPQPKDAVFLPFVLLLAVIVLSWSFSTRRRDWTKAVLLALVTWQACLHLRHIALVAILAGFWLPGHVQSALDRLRRGRASESVSLGRAAPWVATGLGCVLLFLVGKLYFRLADLPVEKDEYPVEAIQFVADHGLSGRMVVAFNWAQYALFALQPQVQVGFDGRFNTCYPRQVIDMHFDFLIGDKASERYRAPDSGPIDGERVLSFHDPDLVLVDRRFPHSVKVMRGREDFVLLYQDGLAQLWGRRDRYDASGSPTYVPLAKRSISDAPQTGSVTWPARPHRDRLAPVARTESDTPAHNLTQQGNPS